MLQDRARRPSGAGVPILPLGEALSSQPLPPVQQFQRHGGKESDQLAHDLQIQHADKQDYQRGGGRGQNGQDVFAGRYSCTTQRPQNVRKQNSTIPKPPMTFRIASSSLTTTLDRTVYRTSVISLGNSA